MLRTALMQHGWGVPWIDAAFDLARRQTASSQAAPQSGPAPMSGMSGQAAFSAHQPPSHIFQSVAGVNPAAAQSAQTIGQSGVPPLRPKKSRRSVWIFVLIASMVVPLGTALVITMSRANKTAQEQSIRDEARRSDLAAILNGLSDYYVAQDRYPTRNELNDSKFREAQDLDERMFRDPQWSPAGECSDGDKAILTSTLAPSCYAYRASTSEGSVCDNKTAPCTRMTIALLFESDSEATTVTFDRNTEIDAPDE